MALNETRPIITAEQHAELEKLLLDKQDRKGFYVALYEMTGSLAALDMAEITSSSGILGGTAWAINEWMARTMHFESEEGDVVFIDHQHGTTAGARPPSAR